MKIVAVAVVANAVWGMTGTLAAVMAGGAREPLERFAEAVTAIKCCGFVRSFA